MFRRVREKVIEEVSATNVEAMQVHSSPQEAPVIIKRLEGAVVPLGATVEFNVEVRGHPAPVLAWYFNEEMVEESDHCHIFVNGSLHKLSFQNVTHRNTGTIRCIAINEVGRDQCEATLRIDQSRPSQKNTIPKFISQMKSLQLIEGGDAHFEVSFEGNPPPEVSWFKDSIFLTDDYGVEIVTQDGESELYLPDVGKDDSGKYYCVLQNRLGKTQCFGELFVSEQPVSSTKEQVVSDRPVFSTTGPPLIVEKPGDIRVFEGDSVCLVFRAIGDPPLSGKFLWDGKDLSDDIHFSIEEKDDIWKLTLKQAELYLQGVILFVAENDKGLAECSVKLKVDESIVAPMFTKTAENIYVRAGDRCQFSVKVKGKPLPRVEWYKNGRLLSDKEEIHIYRDGDKHSLIIRKASREWAGKFKCVAVNNAGEASCSAMLNIDGDGKAPRFVSALEEQECSEGDVVKLSVKTQGKPNPEIKWYKNNILLRSSKRLVMESDGENHSLIIKRVDDDDCGMFKCAATNSYGSVISEAFLNVMEKSVPPVLAKRLQDVTAKENGKLELEVCLEEGSHHSTQWYRNGEKLKSTTHCSISKWADKDRLVIEKVLKNDEGEYVCVIHNDSGECSTTAKVTVTSPSTKEFVDDDVVMSVNTAETNTMPTIVLGDGANDAAKDEKRFVISPGKALKLTIKETGDDGSGQFRLVAAGSLEDARPGTSASVSEEEQDFPPEFISALEDIDLVKGKSAKFEVGIIGQPCPKVTWLKDGVQLRENSKVKFGLQNRVHSVTIERCDAGDIGCYECVAINSKGRISCQAMLSVDSDFGSVERYENAQRRKSEEGLSPKFHKTISDLRIKEGGPLKFPLIF